MRTVTLSIQDLKTPLKWAYTISDDGTVYNVSRKVAIQGTSISAANRYKKIHLDKFRALHRLVAEHFVYNPKPAEYTQINHIDGDRWNNSAINLEWVSPSQNVRHAYSNGLKTNRGEINPFSRLTEQAVRNIRNLAEAGVSDQAIIDRLQLCVGRGTVKRVRTHRSWKHVV